MNEKNLSNQSETDWERLKTISDEEIDVSDIPPLDESFFADAKLRLPEGKESVLLNVDAEVLAWYRKHGTDFQTLVNVALRDFANTHQR